jgi:RNA polymerase sigma-70 factor, ECF subfamily
VVLSTERRAAVRRVPERGMSDVALVRAMVSGNIVGASTLFDRHGGIMYGVARCMLADDNIAQETVIDAFARVAREARSFDESHTTVRSWLIQLVCERAIHHIRARPPITHQRLITRDGHDVCPS